MSHKSIIHLKFQLLLNYYKQTLTKQIQYIQQLYEPVNDYIEQNETKQQLIEYWQEEAKKYNNEAGSEIFSLFFIEYNESNNYERLAQLCSAKLYLNFQKMTTSAYEALEYMLITQYQGIVLSWWGQDQCTFYSNSFYYFNPWDLNSFISKINQIMQLDSSYLVNKKYLDFIDFRAFTPLHWFNKCLLDLQTSYSDTLLAHISKYKKKTTLLKFAHRKFMPAPIERICKAYTKTKCRLIILTNEGTLIKQQKWSTTLSTQFNKLWVEPPKQVLDALQVLCSDPQNTVYIVTEQTTEKLGVWYNQVKNLGIACEYGYLYKAQKGGWVNLFEIDKTWQHSVLELFKKYEAGTEGSSIEEKVCSVVWKYSNIDREFAKRQGNALVKELKKLYSNQQEIDVVRGENYIEVRPFGMNKGTVAEMLLRKVHLEQGKMDFVLVIGNSLQDEEMIASIKKNRQYYPEYFEQKSYHYLCTVGQKPSNAVFYLENDKKVASLLDQLSNCSQNQK